MTITDSSAVSFRSGCQINEYHNFRVVFCPLITNHCLHLFVPTYAVTFMACSNPQTIITVCTRSFRMAIQL